jgi:non-heme chloroperoxidase
MHSWPDRGPLLIIDGEKDHTVPWAIANAAYKRQRRNPGVTEIVKIPNRGHALTIDHGWQEVAQTALDFVKRFVPAKPSSAASIWADSPTTSAGLPGPAQVVRGPVRQTGQDRWAPGDPPYDARHTCGH